MVSHAGHGGGQALLQAYMQDVDAGVLKSEPKQLACVGRLAAVLDNLDCLQPSARRYNEQLRVYLDKRRTVAKELDRQEQLRVKQRQDSCKQQALAMIREYFDSSAHGQNKSCSSCLRLQ